MFFQCMLKSNFVVYRVPYIILVRVAVLIIREITDYVPKFYFNIVF